MNTNRPIHSPDCIDRRDAIIRVGLLLGTSLSFVSDLSGQNRRDSSSHPLALNRIQMDTVRAISDRILPATDTPGAIDVGVPEFIDSIYAKYLTEVERTTFTQGLTQINAMSRHNHNAVFSQIAYHSQDEVLRAIAEGSRAKGNTFFRVVRDLTLIGYFTSETVGKEVLLFDPIPGEYRGCIPLSEVGGSAWAL